jgi:signal transduction histidine kinase
VGVNKATTRASVTFAVGLVALAAMVVLYAIWAGHREDRRRAEQGAEGLALTAAHAQEQRIDHGRQLLGALAGNTELSGDRDACERALRRSWTPGVVGNLLAVDRDGGLRCAVLPGASALGHDDRAWLGGLLTGGGDARVTVLGGRPVLLVGRPAGPGALVAALDLEEMRPLHAAAALPVASSFTLFDRSGRVLVHDTDGVRWGGRSGIEAAGEPRLHGLAAVRGHGGELLGHIAVGVPAALAASVARIGPEALLLACLAVALALACALAAARRLPAGDLARLERAAGRLATGEPARPVAAAVLQPELHHLGEVLDHVAGAIDRREQARGERLQRLEQTARELIERQEAERRSLAGALHGELGELLASLSVTLDGMLHQPPREAAATLAEAQDLVAELMQRTRELAEELRPPSLDELGLAAAIGHRLRRFEAATGIGVTLRHYLAGVQPSDPVAITAYRVVEEALQQIPLRAGTQAVHVRLFAADGGLHIEVADDGVGVADGSQLKVKGLFLVQERVRLLGGSLRQDAGGARNTVAVELPLGASGLTIEPRWRIEAGLAAASR